MGGVAFVGEAGEGDVLAVGGDDRAGFGAVDFGELHRRSAVQWEAPDVFAVESRVGIGAAGGVDEDVFAVGGPGGFAAVVVVTGRDLPGGAAGDGEDEDVGEA